jgi:hypothetical protein
VFLSQLFYAILLAPLQPKQSLLNQLRVALFQRASKHKRTVSTVNLIDSVIPGIANRISSWMYKKNRFPWSPVDIELIASGSGAAVFKLNWEKGDTVLRIYRKSLGKSLPGLLEMAEYYKRNYETVLSWYGAARDLVLPMEFLVLQGLPLIGPIAASLQPYVNGQKQDLFEDFSDGELLKLFAVNDHVREQFLLFAKQTLSQWAEGDICYDFVGRENLMLVKRGGTYRLHIVDVGIFKPHVLADHSSEKVAKIQQRMDRLTSLYEQAKRI